MYMYMKLEFLATYMYVHIYHIIFVDYTFSFPCRYFYWVIEGSLVKLNYSRVIGAGETTNLTPFQLTIDSATSFTLDLADSQYYYISEGRTTVRRGLGDNLISESGAYGVIPTLRTSFGERVVLTLTAAPDMVFFRDAGADAGSFGDFSFMNDMVSDAIVLRSSYQPLPGKQNPFHILCRKYSLRSRHLVTLFCSCMAGLCIISVHFIPSSHTHSTLLTHLSSPIPVPPGPVTNIRVLAETDTATISWDATEFISSILGK